MKDGIDFGGLIDRLFPPKYDFVKMLGEQASMVVKGIEALSSWMTSDGEFESDELIRIDRALDDSRHKMENALLEAFTTPFDRRDIYSIAHQMGEILDFIVSTRAEMKVLGVKADEPLTRMTNALNKGMKEFAQSLASVQTDAIAAENKIREIRRVGHEIEDIYMEALAQALKNGDAVDAIRRREIYHHMKDASRALGLAVDILHRIIVSIA